MNREKVIIRTSFVGIAANIVLVALKMVFGVIAGSLSFISDAINNLTDALSSIITIIGTKLSNKKPDAKHPFGHGRVEYITSFIIGVIIIVAGVSAIREAIEGFINPSDAKYDLWSFIVVSAAILIKILLGIFFRIMGKKVNSASLSASGLDALLDSILTFSTLVGAIVSYFWGVSIENYLSITIGLFIIRSGVGVLRESVATLIGTKGDADLVQSIYKLIRETPEVKGVYDVIMHDYGPNRTIASVHIEVDDSLKATDIHRITRQITEKVFMQYGIILTVGIYASNTEDVRYAQIKEDLFAIIREKKDILQIHGFYVDEKNKNISFDLVLDFKSKNPEETVFDIRERISKKYPDYNFNIIVDSDFVGLDSK
ncbi:MAG: cation transporter [Bacilli bacterium]|nr:cation transporter [Bacilli bacterium]